MLKIKLFPKGKKHQRSFRIVVAEARSKSNGKVVADLGFVTPQTKTINIDKEKLSQWLKNGAKLSYGVDRLLNPDKYPKKFKPKKTAELKVETKSKFENKTEIEAEKTEIKPELKTETPVAEIITDQPEANTETVTKEEPSADAKTDAK